MNKIENQNRAGKKVIFIGLSGYGYPHTRVRCYHFQRELSKLGGPESSVLSFRDHLGPEFTEANMYAMKDRNKLRLTWRGFKRLWPERGHLFYLQKAHFHSAAPYLLHRLGRNPYIFDYDDYDVDFPNFFYYGFLNRLFFGSNCCATITERIARRALCCVAASHELIDYLKPFNSHVYYIPTGTDTELFEPKPIDQPGKGPVVFFWNGLIWGEPIFRSVQLLLNAFGRVYQSEKNVELRIIGGGKLFDQLEKMLREEYSTLPVHVLGWMDPKEMPNQLKQVNVGCLPLHADVASRWIRSKSPTKMFEYMAAGLPVVSSAIGEPVHVIENEKSGFLVQDEEEMAAKMLLLAENPDLRKKMGIAARLRIEKDFSIRVLGKRLQDCLAEQGWAGNP